MTSDDARKLFVAGLTESIDENLLRSLFEGVGVTVVGVSLPKDRATGRPRGFGFVTLSTEEEADMARNSLDGSIQSGRAISVRRFHVEPPKRADARPPDPVAAAGSGESSTLYVGNLPYDVTQSELEEVFVANGFGAPSRLHMPVSPDGRSRGFGFVTLATADAAQRAVQTLHQSDLKGRRLIVNLAHAKADRPQPPERLARRPRTTEVAREPSLRPSDPPRPSAAPFGGGFEESSRPVEGRRARAGEAKKKKKAKRRTATDVQRRERGARGGAGSWQKWTDWDED